MLSVISSFVFWLALFIGSVLFIFTGAVISRRTHKRTLFSPLGILGWNISTIAIPFASQPNLHIPLYIAIPVGIAFLVLFVISWWDIFTGKGRKLGNELITTGMYKVVRHPIYSGHIFKLLGLSIIVGGALYALYFCVFFLGLEIAIILKEEELLEEQFGEEYERYRKQVKWRLIPFLF